jgi:hypothetical protein
MSRVSLIREAQEDIRVEEVGHLVVVSIYVSAGEIWRKRREMF